MKTHITSLTRRTLFYRTRSLFLMTMLAGGLALASPQPALGGDSFDYGECTDAAESWGDDCAAGGGWWRRVGCAVASAAWILTCATVEAIDIMT